MMWARIVNSTVAEVIGFNPDDRFHPEAAKLFVSVPNGTSVRDIKNIDGTFTKYTAPPAPDTRPAQRDALQAQLSAIDAKSDTPRARREALLGNTTWLALLDAQASALRTQLGAIT